MTASSTFNANDGNQYELQMCRWSRRLAGPFLDFVGTSDGEHVLDVGCGTGCLALALAEGCRIGQVRSVDISTAYVEHAARHNQDARIAYEAGDACALRLPDRTFDRVLSLLMLHSAGFAHVAEATLSIRMEYTSFEDYWAPYDGTEGPQAEYIATLTDAERTRLRDAVRLAYVDGEPDGPRSYAALAWAVKGHVPG